VFILKIYHDARSYECQISVQVCVFEKIYRNILQYIRDLLCIYVQIIVYLVVSL